ncbi:ATP-binding cassette domain-containing protein [Hydrogenoanaerobacterium sp.]|uniref:ABC transporter ATP-binding protein n=1 Tax=Hydrogenoanaerobacterium sp. TaxID=2953763 RepID=UPI00289BD209|nr:ATP-binding cassette domain-containing protein [Hydrogenoanaerobacterium sp.]
MFEISKMKFKSILDIPKLTIDRQITCIVGASGSGKTTLLRMLNRLNAPDEGTIVYDGDDISQMDAVKLRRRVVMLGQTPVIYSGDIRDNLQIGLELSQKLPATERALQESLEHVGLSKALDEPCGNLSGGEKQRLCLARVLLMDAETYLLDEPSAALDKETEQFIIQNLADFVRERGKQLIMVTHSEAIAGLYRDSTIRIEAGKTRGYQL